MTNVMKHLDGPRQGGYAENNMVWVEAWKINEKCINKKSKKKTEESMNKLWILFMNTIHLNVAPGLSSVLLPKPFKQTRK